MIYILFSLLSALAMITIVLILCYALKNEEYEIYCLRCGQVLTENDLKTVENKTHYICPICGKIKEFIYCKDCKHNVLTDEGDYNSEDIVCAYWESDGLDSYDFCSQGERKDIKK